MSRKNYIILLVEDDPNDIILIKRAFEKANLMNPIYVVEDGEKAISYLGGKGEYRDREKHPLPVLILLDLKLPRKSGHQVLRWLRERPGLKRIPVVVLTSSKEMADINKSYDLGANSYLVKPVSFNALLNMLKTLKLYWLILNEKPEVRSN